MGGEVRVGGGGVTNGGVKEKVLGAHRAGIRRVILPKRNEADLDDIPPDLRRQIEFVMVESIDEVLKQALAHDDVPAKAATNGASDGPVVANVPPPLP